jgi:nucleotide-binding universal stress UspA family protein
MKIEFTRILVAIDFSEESRAAMKFGMALAAQVGAALHLLHVVEVIAGAEPLSRAIETRLAIEQAIEATAWDELGRMLSPAEQTRFRAALAVEWGSPFDEIIRYARSRNIDLITMGTHGRGGVRRLVIGSVAENVVRHASCAVLTVNRTRPELLYL